jgi:hypothetical protein
MPSLLLLSLHLSLLSLALAAAQSKAQSQSQSQGRSDGDIHESSASLLYSFELNEAFFYGEFGGYDSAAFSLSSDSVVDFWVTDKQNFDLWLNQDTIPTAKMFRSTFCNDCTSHSTTFLNPSPGSGSFYWVVSAVFPTRTDADGTLSVNYVGSGYFNEPIEAEDTVATCFAGTSTVQREDGSKVELQELQVGESVLAVDTDGSLTYSPVVSVPHAKSKGRRLTTFHHINHFGGELLGPLEVTRNHLVVTCPQQESESDSVPSFASCSSCPISGSHLSPLTSLSVAQDVTTSMCVFVVADGENISHWAPVTAVGKQNSRRGLYSVVTRAAYPVVSGVAASPFASSHVLGHAYHSYLVPLYTSFMHALGVSSDEESLANGVSTVLNTPSMNRALLWFSGRAQSVLASRPSTIFSMGGGEF